MRDYYTELEVSSGASSGVIAAAYRHLARVHHPDLAGEAGARRMRAINEAYETLSDPERRRAYDLALATAPGGRDPWPARAARSEDRRPRAGFLLAFGAGVLVAAAVGWGAVLLLGPGGSRAAAPVASGGAGPGIGRARSVLPATSSAAGPRAPASSVTVAATSAPAATPSPSPEASPEPQTVAVSAPQPAPEPAATPAPEPEPRPSATPVPAPTRAPAPPAPVLVYVRHVVQPGENLSRIAELYGVAQATILAVNGLTDPDRILFGQDLLIPQWR